MTTDIKIKRAKFIDKSTEIRETFSFADPVQILQAVNIYCCDHYGSMSWDLQSKIANQYFNSWSTCVKLAWEVPRDTHSYFLDYLSGNLVAIKRDILGRYVGFYQSLLNSPSREVNILARIVFKDIRTTTARNLRFLEQETGGVTWPELPRKIKGRLQERQPVVPREDQWRVQYLGKLLEERDILRYEGLEGSKEVELVQGLIDSLCTN